MKNKKIKSIFTLLVMVFTVIIACDITSYAYDEDVIEYIADAIEDTKETVDGIEKYNVKKSELTEIFQLALAQNYELAYTYDWIRMTGWSCVSDDVYTIRIKYDFDNATTNAEVKERYVKVDAELDKIEAMVDDSWSDFDKILFIHDYIVENISYDWDGYLNGKLEDTQFCLYGALSGDKVVCEAYSKLFMVIMHRLGFESVLVTSDARAHMWNMVKLDGKWYHVDCTYDDPIMSGADTDLKGKVSHTYFLLSDTAIADSGHYPWNEGVPTCTSTTYDDWKYRDSVSKFIPLDGDWYFSDPSNSNNLVKRSESGKVTVLSENGAYGLAQIDGRIYYTDKYRKDIYIYYNGKTTKVYSLNNDKYISSLGLKGTQMEIVVFDASSNYSWIKLYVGSDYNLSTTKSYSGVVTNLKVTAAPTSMKLTWSKAEGATKYKVYIYSTNEGKYVLKNDNVTTTSCTITGLSSAKEYKFKVVAYSNSLASSKSVTVAGSTTTKSVSSVSHVSNTMTTITIKYPTVSGASGYRIQVYNPATKKTVKTLYTSEKQYKITGLAKGTKYNVYVTPYKWYDGKKLFATTRKAVATTTKTGKPTLKVSTQSSTSVKLTWNKVTGATGYRVYKYNSTKKTYVKYKDVTTNYCTVTKLSPGKTYKFAIAPITKITSSVSGTKVTKSFYSDKVTLGVCTAPASPKPTLSTANKAITVKWGKVTGATSYVVYYKTSANGKWIKAGTTSKTTYKISNLVKGKKYYVTVKAYKKYNKQNAASLTTTKYITVK